MVSCWVDVVMLVFPLISEVAFACARWGISRHFHYIPEILGAFFWTLPGLLNHVRSSTFYALAGSYLVWQSTIDCRQFHPSFLFDIFYGNYRCSHTFMCFSWPCSLPTGATVMINGAAVSTDSIGMNIAGQYHTKWSLGFFKSLWSKDSFLVESILAAVNICKFRHVLHIDCLMN